MSERLIYALDAASLPEAETAARLVVGAGAVGMVKVGLELFVEAGPAAVGMGLALGVPVFLDLKLHDIPETVERAVGRATALGARILTVHAAGGPEMLRRAAARAEREGAGLLVAAVTVLTSLDQGDLARIGVGGVDVRGQVLRLARMAFDEGVRAFVCSPNEVAAMRVELGDAATLITPGVRPAGVSGADDQKRVATPAAAMRDGADYLVVGRPIRDAADPLAAAQAISREIEAARGGRDKAAR